MCAKIVCEYVADAKIKYADVTNDASALKLYNADASNFYSHNTKIQRRHYFDVTRNNMIAIATAMRVVMKNDHIANSFTLDKCDDSVKYYTNKVYKTMYDTYLDVEEIVAIRKQRAAFEKYFDAEIKSATARNAVEVVKTLSQAKRSLLYLIDNKFAAIEASTLKLRNAEKAHIAKNAKNKNAAAAVA
jgi:hypothetical protein